MIKSILISILFAATILAIAFLFSGCSSVPPILIEGKYGDYSYSSKGIVIKPHITPYRVRLYPTK